MLAYGLLWWPLDPAPAGHWPDRSGEAAFPPPSENPATTAATCDVTDDGVQAA